MAIDISKMTIPELLTHISELPAAKKATALKQIADLTPELKTYLLQLCDNIPAIYTYFMLMLYLVICHYINIDYYIS